MWTPLKKLRCDRKYQSCGNGNFAPFWLICWSLRCFGQWSMGGKKTAFSICMFWTDTLVWAAVSARASHWHFLPMNPWLEHDDSCYRGLENAPLYRIKGFVSVREESKQCSQETVRLVSKLWCQSTKWRLPKSTAKYTEAVRHRGVGDCTSRTFLAPRHVAGFKARLLEGPKALALGAERYKSQTEAFKAFCNKRDNAEEDKKIPLWEQAANEDFEPEIKM